MIMVLGPHKKKADAKVDMKAAKESKAAERAAHEADERAERDAAHAAGPVAQKKERGSLREPRPRDRGLTHHVGGRPPDQAVVEPCRDHPAPSREKRRCRRTRRTPVPASASA